LIAGAKVHTFFEPTKYFPNFFQKTIKKAPKQPKTDLFKI